MSSNSLNINTPRSRDVESASIASTGGDDKNKEKEILKGFASIREVQQRPAHLSVLLDFLLGSGSNAELLLFILEEDKHCRGSSSNTQGDENKKLALDIHAVYLAPHAPLRLQLDEKLLQATESRLNSSSSLTGDEMRDLFKPVVDAAHDSLESSLARLRAAISEGNAGYVCGSSRLTEDISEAEEQGIVVDCIIPHLERFAAVIETSQKAASCAQRMLLFLEVAGIDPAVIDQLTPQAVKLAFTRKNSLKTIVKSGGKKVHIYGSHHFVATHYNMIQNCHFCGDVLWGLGNQGYECQLCGYIVHKRKCVTAIIEKCLGEPATSVSRFKSNRRNRGSKLLSPGSSNSIGSRSGSPEAPESPVSIKKRQLANSSSVPFNPSLRESHRKSRSMDNLSEKLSVECDSQVSVQSDRASIGNISYISGVSVNSSSTVIPELHRESFISGEEAETVDMSSDTRDRSCSEHSNRLCSSPRDSERNSLNEAVIEAKTSKRFSLSKSLNNMDSIADDALVGGEGEGAAMVESEKKKTPKPTCWTMSVPDDVVASVEKNEIRRQEAIWELISTERTYCGDLETLSQVFYGPLVRSKMIVSKDADKLFSNVDDLLSVNLSLLSSLITRQSKSDIVGNIGDIYVREFAYFDVYAKFCANTNKALAMVSSLTEKMGKFERFLEEIQELPVCRRLPLSYFLTMPMQRLTRYPMLLDAVVKYTSAGHPDYDHLIKALSAIKTVARTVNLAVRKAENREKLEQIQATLDFTLVSSDSTRKLSIVNDSRELIKNGPLLMRLQQGSKKLAKMHVFLFNDLVLITQKKDKKFDVVERPINLVELLVRNVETLQQKKDNAFLFVSTSGKEPKMFECQAADDQEKQGWLSAIADAIKKTHLNITLGKASNKVDTVSMSSRSSRSRSPNRDDSKSISDSITSHNRVSSISSCTKERTSSQSSSDLHGDNAENNNEGANFDGELGANAKTDSNNQEIGGSVVATFQRKKRLSSTRNNNLRSFKSTVSESMTSEEDTKSISVDESTKVATCGANTSPPELLIKQEPVSSGVATPNEASNSKTNIASSDQESISTCETYSNNAAVPNIHEDPTKVDTAKSISDPCVSNVEISEPALTTNDTTNIIIATESARDSNKEPAAENVSVPDIANDATVPTASVISSVEGVKDNSAASIELDDTVVATESTDDCEQELNENEDILSSETSHCDRNLHNDDDCKNDEELPDMSDHSEQEDQGFEIDMNEKLTFDTPIGIDEDETITDPEALKIACAAHPRKDEELPDMNDQEDQDVEIGTNEKLTFDTTIINDEDETITDPEALNIACASHPEAENHSNVEQLRKQNVLLTQEVVEHHDTIRNMEIEVMEIEELVAVNDELIESINAKLAIREQDVKSKSERIECLLDEIKQLRQKNESEENENDMYSCLTANADSKIADLQDDINSKNGEIEELKILAAKQAEQLTKRDETLALMFNNMAKLKEDAVNLTNENRSSKIDALRQDVTDNDNMLRDVSMNISEANEVIRQVIDNDVGEL